MPPGSSDYYKTTVYVAMTLQDCIDDDGRLPLYLQKQYLAEQQVETAIGFCRANPSDPSCPQLEEAALKVAAREEVRAEEEDANIKEFAGFRWGIGIAALNYGDSRIDEVKVIDGTVRVTEERDNKAAVMFESHIFIHDGQFRNQRYGIGPFLAVSLSDTEGADPLSSYGAGLMLGFKRREGSGSWNIGAGYFVDTEAVRFLDGVSDGSETDVTDVNNLTRSTDQEGFMIMFSTTW